MEEKTMGKFIAALRKAKGMTQRDLAEALNVSDKSVSRWELDNGAPDLATIPAIAELFGVTCDELLRGERVPAASQEPSPKGEKQRRNLLARSLTQYRNKSLVSMGLSVFGLIGAMICNLGFLRGYLGFLVGAAFYAASLVCQAVALNGALFVVSDEEFSGAEGATFKNKVILLAKNSIFMTLLLVGYTLPLLVFPYDAYSGVTGLFWLVVGGVCALAVWVVCAVFWYWLYARLVRKGTISLSDAEAEEYWRGHRLQRKCVIVLAIVLVVTAAAQVWIQSAWAISGAKGTRFDNVEDFVAFMAQESPYPDGSLESLDNAYYDEFGNAISKEDALRHEIRIDDGTEDGKLVCEYIWRNHSVVRIRNMGQNGGLPITVYTQEQIDAANQTGNLIGRAFFALYAVECLAAVLAYFIMSRRPAGQPRDLKC